MRTPAAVASLAFALLLLAAGDAVAALCATCKDKAFIQNIGSCQNCRAETSSGAFKLCPACSARLRQCEACRGPLGAAGPAERPKEGAIQTIDPNQSGTYQSGKWEYRFEVRARGTKAEGRFGLLFHDSRELPEPKAVNSAIQTPWGILYWVGMPKPLWGSHGWMQHPAPGGGSVVLLPDPAEGTPMALKRVDVGEDLNGKSVTLKAAEAAAVRLPGNITTGYAWQVAQLDGEAVAQVGKVEYATSQAPGDRRVGVGGVFIAIFQAVKPGQATVKMAYSRPWEKDTAPAKTFTVTFSVEAAEPQK